jgi:hypothetical protein
MADATSLLQLEIMRWAADLLLVDAVGNFQPDPNHITASFVQNLNNTVKEIFDLYPSTYAITGLQVTDILTNISTIPDAAWGNFTNDPAPPTAAQDQLNESLTNLVATVFNSLFVNFKIDAFENLEVNDDPSHNNAPNAAALQEQMVCHLEPPGDTLDSEG